MAGDARARVADARGGPETRGKLSPVRVARRLISTAIIVAEL